MLKIAIILSLLINSASSLADISKEESIQIADAYIRRVDGGFLESQIKKSPLKRDTNRYTDLTPDGLSITPFYSVYFHIFDYEQELIFEFSVKVLDNGQVVPPRLDDPHYGTYWGTYPKWLQKEDFCSFHPQDPKCFWETPI